MLSNKIFTDIAHNRDKIASRLQNSTDYPRLIEAARNCWNEYEPTKKETISIAVDGGKGFEQFQGLNAYVVDSVAMTSSGRAMEGAVGRNGTGFHWEYDVAAMNIQHVLNRMLRLEMRMLTEVLDFDYPEGTYPLPDLILQDGSLSAWFLSAAFTGELHETRADIDKFLNALKKQANLKDLTANKKVLVFVSKSSDSTRYFSRLGIKNRAGDIYYFNHMGHRQAGYSFPRLGDMSKEGKEEGDWYEFQDKKISVITFYARLRRDTPMLKFELPNLGASRLDDDEYDNLTKRIVPELLDRLAYHSVAGYPYRLVQAHQNAAIPKNDMMRVIQLLPLQNEVGSREALEE